MKVSAMCFGQMREFLPPDAEGNRATLELDDTARVLDLVHLLGAPERLIYALLVNGERGRLEDPLANYRDALDGFDPAKIARYDETKVEMLLTNKGLIRNRAKMNAVVSNARAFLEVRDSIGSFSDYIWQFVDGKPVVNGHTSMEDLPAETEESRAMSKDLKRRGFKFVGPTICYAHMQATGMVNDHIVSCWRYRDLL